jgi:hypothetical protein
MPPEAGRQRSQGDRRRAQDAVDRKQIRAPLRCRRGWKARLRQRAHRPGGAQHDAEVAQERGRREERQALRHGQSNAHEGHEEPHHGEQTSTLQRIADLACH